MNGDEEVGGGLVISGRDSAVLLELGKEVLDQVACLVQLPVVLPSLMASACGRDHHRLAGILQRLD